MTYEQALARLYLAEDDREDQQEPGGQQLADLVNCGRNFFSDEAVNGFEIAFLHSLHISASFFATLFNAAKKRDICRLECNFF